MDGQALHLWLRAAQDDFTATQFLMDEEPLRREIVCFHAEQAVEKILKAFLVYHGKEIPEGKDCAGLLEACVAIEPSLARFRDTAALVSPYADYDEAFPAWVELSDGEMAQAVDFAGEVLDAVQPLLAG